VVIKEVNVFRITVVLLLTTESLENTARESSWSDIVCFCE